LWGGFVMMLGHGLSSVALFFLVGCLYDRYHERLIEYYGGLSQSSPVLAFFMFYFVTVNFGFPYNVNFLAEVFIIAGVFKLDLFILMLLGFSLILGVAYKIYFYEKVFLGTVNTNYIKIFMDMSFREILVVFPLFF
jgi:NADH:ubiquinone oxidoreductase subunit 4 (subunit M)